jgi:phage shock protein A
MSDFIKKLNVLVRASLNDALQEVSQPRSIGWPSQKVDQEVSTLRQRINEALDYEDELVQRVQQLQAEAQRLDQEADDLVEQGRDDHARALVSDLNRAQQRLAMAESDLRQHRVVTQELITRVNELEAAVADMRRSQSQEEAESPEPESEDTLERAGQVISEVLKDMRDKIAEMSETVGSTLPADVNDAVDEAKIEDDLEARRNRLSKK